MDEHIPAYSIRLAQRHSDDVALNALARDAVDEAQGPYATRRRGSVLHPSAFDDSVVFVAEALSDRRLVGFVAVRLTDIRETEQSHAVRRADITMLGVIPEFRRNGLGRSLVQRAIEQARECEATLITLCVEEQNRAAIGLYESIGWIAVDRMMVYPNPDS